jgi:hypothetical protein
MVFNVKYKDYNNTTQILTIEVPEATLISLA